MKNSLPDSGIFDPEGFFISVLHEAAERFNVDFQLEEESRISVSPIIKWHDKSGLQYTACERVIRNGFFEGLAFAFTVLTGKEFVFQEISRSEKIREIQICPHNLSRKDTFSRYSRANIPILIQGPSGTGKTFLARFLHILSGRTGSVIELHLEAIPESLVELELFGAVKGSFTDAGEDRIGKIEAADNGTLIIENIENLNKSVQGKIGEFLGESKFHPLGSNEARKVDCLVVCTSRFDASTLLEMDLVLPSFLYRINALPISLDPLSVRHEDQKFFFEMVVADSGLSGTDPGLFHDFRGANAESAWPGNIPQFMNAVKAWFAGEHSSISNHTQLDLKKLVEDYKRSLIHDILRRNNGNRTKTASMLGIQRTYLVKLIRDFQIETINNAGE